MDTATPSAEGHDVDHTPLAEGDRVQYVPMHEMYRGLAGHHGTIDSTARDTSRGKKGEPGPWLSVRWDVPRPPSLTDGEYIYRTLRRVDGPPMSLEALITQELAP